MKAITITDFIAKNGETRIACTDTDGDIIGYGDTWEEALMNYKMALMEEEE